MYLYCPYIQQCFICTALVLTESTHLFTPPPSFFLSLAMALILPLLKDNTNFVLKLALMFACHSIYILSLLVCLSVYDCHKFFESSWQGLSKGCLKKMATFSIIDCNEHCHHNDILSIKSKLLNPSCEWGQKTTQDINPIYG